MTSLRRPTARQRALLTQVDSGLVWRNDRTGRAYYGSGTPGHQGREATTAPDVTGAVGELLAAEWIEMRPWPSWVYRLTDAGREALTHTEDSGGGDG